jgi:hypothetical protein
MDSVYMYKPPQSSGWPTKVFKSEQSCEKYLEKIYKDKPITNAWGEFFIPSENTYTYVGKGWWEEVM